jgi:hypothetical protein
MKNVVVSRRSAALRRVIVLPLAPAMAFLPALAGMLMVTTAYGQSVPSTLISTVGTQPYAVAVNIVTP